MDNDDAKSSYSYVRNEPLNALDFDTRNTFTTGIRNSAFGFTTLPDVKAFQRVPNG